MTFSPQNARRDSAESSSSTHSSILAYGEAPLPATRFEASRGQSQTSSSGDSTVREVLESPSALEDQTPDAEPNLTSGRYQSRAFSVVGFATTPRPDSQDDISDDDDHEEQHEGLEMGVLARGSGGRGGWYASSQFAL